MRGQSLVLALVGVLTLCYPLLVYAGLQLFPPWTIGVALLGLMGLRLAMSSRRSPLVVAGWLAAFAFLAILLISPLDGVRLYPVIVSLTLAAVFAATLIHPPSAIERIARMREPDLPLAGIVYTRNVTAVWLAFFLLNASIAAWTASYASLETWTLYNGLISYIAIGLLMAVEFLLRQRILRRR